jgi:SAM-dependent methyltransferase
MALESKRLFDLRDLGGLGSFLCRWAKYRFVLNEVRNAPNDARVLEVGCSRGYLTAFFILGGKTNILGVDVSSEAVDHARAAFGDYFALASSRDVAVGAPYDIIYHVGMIGCVSDPLGLTRELLGLLKPGGTLLFNAPNLAACAMKNQLWFDSAPPPDLVTLYPPGFWQRQFADIADVREDVELTDCDRSFVLAVRRRFGRSWQPPRPRAFQQVAEAVVEQRGLADRTWGWFERRLGGVARVSGLSRLAQRRPSEYGLFVTMRPFGPSRT